MATAEVGGTRYVFPVGGDISGFRQTVPLSQQIGAGDFLVRVDSSLLTDQRFGFFSSDLKMGYVLVRNGDYVTREEFRAGALCD